MSNKKEVIKGVVSKIFMPKSGMFFEDIEYASFGFKLDNGDFLIASGNTFPIFEKMELVLTGELLLKPNNKYNNFRFVDIERNLSSKESYDELLALITGKGTALTFKEYYGNSKNALDAIANKPDDIINIRGIGEKTKRRILNNYEKNIKVEKTYKELKDYGFSIKDTMDILKKIKNVSVSEIIKNPYVLFKKRVFNFKSCDDIAIRNNLPMDSIERKEAAIFSSIRDNNSQGHTHIPKDQLINDTIKLLTVPNYMFSRNDINQVFENLLNLGHLVQSGEFVYDLKNWQEEEDIRNFVLRNKELSTGFEVDEKDIDEYENLKGFKLGPEQREAVLKSGRSILSVITGGPGTGKTTILDCLMYIFKKKINDNFIGLCSPTGKAARRMTESTGMPASTVHTFLEVDPTRGDLESFVYNKENKLPHKLIVIDEASMIDQFLGASLLRAIKNGTQIIFVGDIEQLPPVGAGYFLRDLINSGVPVSRLIQVYRQAGDSKIIQLSQQIRDNNLFDYKSNGVDFGFVNNVNRENVIKVYLRAVEKVGVENAIILTPQNRTVLGTKDLSNDILNRLIPGETEITKNGWQFKIGARIMQIRNNNELGIVNGQMGFIRDINFEDKLLTLEFDGIDGDVEYDSELIEDIILGYAITIHKSQGSEWKYVIQLVSSMHSMMNTKALVYTGITRAKDSLIIFADEQTFRRSPSRVNRLIRSKIL